MTTISADTTSRHTSRADTSRSGHDDSLYHISKDTTRTLFEYARVGLCHAQCMAESWWRIGRALIKGSILFTLLVSLLVSVAVAVLYGCLVLAFVSSGVLRHAILTNVPGNQLLAVPVNALPFQTEWWRSSPIDDVIQRYLPHTRASLVHEDRAASASSSLSSNPASRGSTSRTGTAATSSARDGAGASAGFYGTDVSSVRNTLGTESNSYPYASHAAPPPAAVSSFGGYSSASASNLIETHAKDLKLAILSRYVRSLIATATLYLPSDTQEEVFLPDGAVNLHAVLAHGEPLFRSHATYTAQAQLVFTKESAGRDVGVVLESAVLFANDARATQAVGALDVLFTTTQTVSVRTGGIAHSVGRAWVWSWVCSLLRLCFWLPISLYETMHDYYYNAHSHLPFAAIDPTREVAVVVDVYTKFTPPLSLQPQLRAMNFTCYQVHDETDRAAKSLNLIRLTLYSSVKLRGLARFFADRPIVSYLLTTALFFVVYVAGVGMSFWALGLYMYIRLWAAPSRPVAESSAGFDTLLETTLLEPISTHSLPGSELSSLTLPRTQSSLNRSGSTMSKSMLAARPLTATARMEKKGQ